MTPAEQENGGATLGQGQGEKTLPLPPANHTPGVSNTIAPESTEDKQKFVFQPGGANAQESGFNLDSKTTLSAREWFSRHIRTITDREAARRHQPPATHTGDRTPSREEGELEPEVGSQMSTLHFNRNKNIDPSHHYELRLRR